MSQYTTSSIYSDASATSTTDIDYEQIQVPVLVIGAGVAGARVAIELRKRSVGRPSDPVQAALDAQYELDYHHLE